MSQLLTVATCWVSSPALGLKFAATIETNEEMVLGDASDQANLAHANSVSAAELAVFDCPFCPRTFPTKIGLGVHKRSAHPVQYHDSQTGALAQSKKIRWTEAEVFHLAQLEKSLIISGASVNINQELLKLLPHRTLELLKGKRKSSRYKEILLQLMSSSSSEDSTDPPDHVAEIQMDRQTPAAKGNHAGDDTNAHSDRLVESQGDRQTPAAKGNPSDDEALDERASSDPDATFILGTIDYYLDDLNSGVTLLPEEHLLDDALRCWDSDKERAKTLSTSFLYSIVRLSRPEGDQESPNRHPELPLHEPSDLSNNGSMSSDHTHYMAADGPNTNKKQNYKVNKKKRRKTNASMSSKPLSRRKQRRQEYALLQKQYKISRKTAFHSIFDKASCADSLTADHVFSFWSHLFERSTISCPAPSEPSRQVRDSSHLVDLISPDEVRAASLPSGTSAGPDEVPYHVLQRIPLRVRCKLYSVWLRLRWLPPAILDSEKFEVCAIFRSD